ncbi:MAG: LysR substrate-binding domain-containing protein, partial [Pseudomonadota bacterium]
LPSILSALSRSFPGLDLMPRESVTKSLVEDLLQSRLDVIVAALPISEPALRELPLFEEEFVLVRAEQDGAQPLPSPENLPEMKLLLLEEGHCFRDQALSFCNRTTEPNLVMEGSSLTTLVQMVSSGLGLTLIPEIAVPLETRQTRLAVSRFRENKPKRTIGMVWRKTNPLEQQLRDIGEIVHEVAQGQVDALRNVGPGQAL